MTKKKKLTPTQTKKLKIKLQSFYKTGPKEAKSVYNALDWAYTEANSSYPSNKIVCTLRRLRDLAAVAIGKLTIEDEDEDW